MANPEDVVRAFTVLLGREPNADESIAQWVGRPIDVLYSQLIASPEHQARRRAAEAADVTRAYRALLGRDPGPQEPIAQWLGRSIDVLYGQLIASAEFQTRRRAAEARDVTDAYQAVLGRVPGPDEPLAQWLGQPIERLYNQL